MIQQLVIFFAIQYVASLVNAKWDAHLIKKKKDPNHSLNLIVFLIMVGVELAIGWYIWWFSLLFFFVSCLNRRVIFGIGLNLFRRVFDKEITWDYISREKPPKAWLDRREIEVFGYNGGAIHKTYIGLWIIFTIALFILTKYL